MYTITAKYIRYDDSFRKNNFQVKELLKRQQNQK